MFLSCPFLMSLAGISIRDEMAVVFNCISARS